MSEQSTPPTYQGLVRHDYVSYKPEDGQPPINIDMWIDDQRNCIYYTDDPLSSDSVATVALEINQYQDQVHLLSTMHQIDVSRQRELFVKGNPQCTTPLVFRQEKLTAQFHTVKMAAINHQ